MGPRLVSLALLLLTLCRQSAGISIKIESLTSVASTSLAPAKQTEAVKEVQTKSAATFPAAADALIKLFELLGNTILALGFIKTDTMQYLPETMRKSMLHGIICEVSDKPNLATEIKGLTGYSHSEEETAAKTIKKMGFDCSAASPPEKDDQEIFDCFCKGDKNPLLYCIAKGLSDFYTSDKAGSFKIHKGNCRKAAVAALVATGTTELGKLYDLDSFGSDSFSAELGSGDIDAITKNEDVRRAKVYCDAINPDVEKAVKEVYAADFAYWLAESLILTALGGSPGKGLAQYCAEDDFKNSHYGKCVCSMDTGFTFCIFKAIGGILKDKGYLACGSTDAEKKFEPAKKPVEPIKIKAAAPKSTSTAATSSLLLAPLAAAAVLLAH